MRLYYQSACHGIDRILDVNQLLNEQSSGSNFATLLPSIKVKTGKSDHFTYAETIS